MNIFMQQKALNSKIYARKAIQNGLDCCCSCNKEKMDSSEKDWEGLESYFVRFFIKK
jgi:hypothetical protein